MAKTSPEEPLESDAPPAVADSLTEEITAPVASPEAPALRTGAAAYLDDDEEFLEAGDEVLHDGEVLKAFAQDDDIISWEISGLLSDEGELLPKRELRAHPPLLEIKSSTGAEVTFVLTQNFTKTLAGNLKRVDSAFYGVDSLNVKKLTWEERRQATWTWVKTHPAKTILLGLFVGVVVFALTQF